MLKIPLPPSAIMLINLTSWNVRGIESPDRNYVVRQFLNLDQNKDFVFLQELKVVGFMLETNLNFIWGNSWFMASKHEKGKWVVAILVANKWKPYLTNLGVSPCNKVVWATFERCDAKFVVCSIYAPNDYLNRSELWRWLAGLPDVPWVLGGDFNMIEH